MARKATSRKPTIIPRSLLRPGSGKPRAARSDPSEAESATQGLLQLAFARHAHGYGFLAAAAFLLDPFLLPPLGAKAQLLPLPPEIRRELFIGLPPAMAGALASWDSVRLKREPYRRHYASDHFAASTAGMVLFFLVAFAIILRVRDSFPLQIVPWIYPLSVAGIPLTIVSMGMTWQGLGARKVGSLGAALIMPIMMVLLVLGGVKVDDPVSGLPDQSGMSLLIVTFLVGALTSEIAGSLLHIIASSTSVYQREILKADNTKIPMLQQDDQKMRQTLNARESSLAEREKEVKRTSIELTSQVRGTDSKVKSIEEREARLHDLEKSFDDKRTQLLKREKDLDLKESELRLRGEQVDATHGGTDASRIRELKDWESKILAKEKEVAKKEVEVKTLETRLRDKSENATRIEKQLGGQRKSFDDRESEFVSREKKISDQEAALRERTVEIERQASAVEEAQRTLDGKTKKYAELFKDAKMKEAAAGSSETETKRQKETLDSRERKLVEMQGNLQAEIKRLNEQNRGLLEKQKELEERESDLHLQSLELEGKAREARTAAPTPGMKDMGREAQLEEWERRLREREEEFKRRSYQKEKEFEMREGAVKARISTAAGTAEAEEAVAVEKKADRVKTGTPRLDDLLYGGIPFNSNVLFVGPAFVGKEVALLNFIAEGLRKGIPAIIITTTKLPIDIAKDIAPILPTFVEYDQLGLVRWIDCTSPMASGKPVKEKNVWRVNGPTDFDNIQRIVNELDEEFKKKYAYFRLAFLTLSSAITQADERDAMNFFQRLVNRLRQTKAVSVVALERGMHTDQTLEALQNTVDGAIHFKSDKQKTMLQVVGLGEVQTHDWVPYKFTNKALMIGSFQLERIR